MRSYNEIEEAILAPYASFSAKTRGRKNPENDHPYRSSFQRDRERIIHSKAFRRLEYKTQVFVYHEGDHYRTRLTHTLEVTQIARAIARTLALNEDLTEAIALSHDLGHPPFGHCGEEVLDSLMSAHGGFEHNLHTLRIVDLIERRYPKFRGLNLTFEVREGIAKHAKGSAKSHSGELDEFSGYPNGSLEAQIVDIADSIAYNSHDIDDGVNSGLVSLDKLDDVKICAIAKNKVLGKYPDIREKLLLSQLVREIINLQATDLIETTRNNIARLGINSVDDARNKEEKTGAFSPEMAVLNKELKKFLRDNMYDQYKVIRMENKAKRILESLFKTYIAEPKTLPPNVLGHADKAGTEKIICDYIAGMTDKYALEEYERLFNPNQRV